MREEGGERRKGEREKKMRAKEREREAQNWSGKSQKTSMKSVGQGWEAGSLNSLVTFALQLIIVTLLNSLWLCEGHLLWFSVSEKIIGHNQTHYWTNCQVCSCYNSLKRSMTLRKTSQYHLYSEQASVCVCDLYVVMCVSCCLELEKRGEVCHLCPSLEVFIASEALQKPAERRR